MFNITTLIAAPETLRENKIKIGQNEYTCQILSWIWAEFFPMMWATQKCKIEATFNFWQCGKVNPVSETLQILELLDTPCFIKNSPITSASNHSSRGNTRKKNPQVLLKDSQGTKYARNWNEKGINHSSIFFPTDPWDQHLPVRARSWKGSQENQLCSLKRGRGKK